MKELPYYLCAVMLGVSLTLTYVATHTIVKQAQKQHSSECPCLIHHTTHTPTHYAF